MRLPTLGLFFCALLSHALAAENRVAFVGVTLDRETRDADQKLRDYLTREAKVDFSTEDRAYDAVVDRLLALSKDGTPFVARVTPYVYLVIDMLGARTEPLATYLSAATNRSTYSSYLVVNSRNFHGAEHPTLFDVVQFLKRKGEAKAPARFVYHNRFSTSSFFLPSLYFRSQSIFNMPESSASLTAIHSERFAENSSTKLVEAVAQGSADIAAVWDGTKKKFDAGGAAFESVGRNVRFVPLPTTMPNDFLICSSSLDPGVRERLRSAITRMGKTAIDVGDFQTWRNIRDEPDARKALAELRWLARERVPPATVDIAFAPNNQDMSASGALVEAARQGVRLAGTELVLFDDDFHAQIDFALKISPLHDGAILLRSTIVGSDLPAQEFRISFRDPEELTRRVVSLVQTRIHRIRYLWPYSSAQPTIIRDMGFSIADNTTVKIQRINWVDPERNQFQFGKSFNARIHDSGFYRYDFSARDFELANEAVGTFDPLGNWAYRAYLLRPSDERRLFKILTYVLLALFVLAGVTASVSFVRAQAQRAS